MIRIEPAKEEHVPHIVALVREFASFEKLDHIFSLDENGLRNALFNEAFKTFCLLAFKDSETVGYALFYPAFKSFQGRSSMYLEDLYVTPGARGQGIGLALLKEVARKAHDAGFDRLDWQALDWNTPAHEFYGALGATKDEGNIDFKLDGESFMKLLK